MTIQKPPIAAPLPMQYLQNCRNREVPDALMGKKILSNLNHLYAYHRKCFFTKAVHFNDFILGNQATLTTWRTRVRTGHGVDGAGGELNLVFDMLIAPADNTAANDPYVDWAVNTIHTDAIHVGIDTISSMAPNKLTHGTIKYAVEPDTIYDLELFVYDRARPVSCCIYEEHVKEFDSGEEAASDASTIYAGSAPITDAQHTQMLFNAHDLWSTNAAPVLSWCTDGDPDAGADAPERTASGYRNILDQGVSTVTNNTPGWNVYMNNNAGYHTEDITCDFAVCGKWLGEPGSTGGMAALKNKTSTLGTLGLWAANDGISWKTTSLVIKDNNPEKLDIHFEGEDQVDAFRVYAAVVYQYIAPPPRP